MKFFGPLQRPAPEKKDDNAEFRATVDRLLAIIEKTGEVVEAQQKLLMNALDRLAHLETELGVQPQSPTEDAREAINKLLAAE